MRRLGNSRRLRAEEDDAQPGMLAMISLLLLLLPFLLLTTSPQKLTALGFRLPAAGEGLPALPPGEVEDLVVRVEANALLLQQALRRTDLLASVGQVEHQELRLAHTGGQFDIPGLQAALRKVKALDPDRERLTLRPAKETTTAEVVRLMDAVRKDKTGPLFQEVVLGATP